MKRGLSTIVSTLLILLLVFVAVGILWVVVRNVIQGGTEQVSLGKFTLDLAIEKVTIAGNTLSVKVKRNSGAGTFTGLNFILDDGDDIEVIQIKNLTMEEYSVRTFQLTLQEISAANVEKVEIAPIFTLESGKEVVGDVKDTYTISKDTGTPYVPPVENCGNGLIDTGEDCDGTNISSSDTCLSEGYDGGTLNCYASGTANECTFDYGSCILESCPDGTIDTGEQCDCGADASCTSTELNSQTCSGYLGTGYSGTLGCSQTSCQFVVTSCTYTPTCGDSLNETGEQCDDGDTGSGDGCSSTCTIESGWTCSGGSGQSSCTEIVTEECGNNLIEGTEVCDGTALNGENCASQMGTGYTGTLSCAGDCSGYVTTSCVPPSGPSWEQYLVARWNFESSGLGTDQVGNNDLTIQGAVADSENMEGSSSIYINNRPYAQDVAYIIDSNLDNGFPFKSTDTTKDITVCAWVRLESVLNSDGGLGYGYFFSKGYTDNWPHDLNFVLFYNGYHFDMRIGYNDAQNYTEAYFPNVASLNRWYFVCGAYEDSSGDYRLRVWDSVTNAPLGSDVTGITGVSATASDYPVCLGLACTSEWSGPHQFDGRLDKMIVFNKALTAEEMDEVRVAS